MQNTTVQNPNMPNSKTTKYLSLVALSSILVACGGGGGSSTPPPTTISSAASSSLAASSSSVANSSVAISSSSASSLASSSSSLASSVASSAAPLTALIKVNQIGYKPGAEKLAVVPAVATTAFTVTRTSDQSVVLTGSLSTAKTWAPANESVKLADFSSLNTEGDYTLSVEGIEKSVNFKISENAYDALNAGAIKAFYFNRASTALLETHAGVYKRPAGHPGRLCISTNLPLQPLALRAP